MGFRKEEMMKKMCIVLGLIIFLSAAYAELPKGWKRSLVQLEARPDIYINGGTDFAISSNVIFNVSQNVGFRVQLAQIFFADETVFRVANSLAFITPTLETFFYVPNKESTFQPYFLGAFSLLAFSDFTLVGLGAGGGADIYLAPKTAVCFEPAVMLYFTEGDSEVMFRGAVGMKFGL